MENNQLSTTFTQHFTKLRIVKNLLVISFSFLFLFTAIVSLVMLQSTINKKKSLGTTSNAVYAVGFLLGALTLPKYVLKKLGCKVTLTISIIAFAPYVVANSYPTWVTLIPSSLLVGLASAILWGSQCTYFNICSVLYCTDNRSAMYSLLTADSSSTESLYNEELETNNTKQGLDMFPESDETVISGKNKDNPATMSTNEVVKSRKNSITFTQTHSSEESYEKKNKGTQTDRNQNGFHPFPVKKELDKKLQPSTPKKINSYPVNQNSTSKLSEEVLAQVDSITPLFFGLHGLLFHSSLIWSNLLSYYVLQNDDSLSNIIVNTTQDLNCACGAAYCNQHSSCNYELIAEPSLGARYSLTGICVTLVLLALLLELLLLDPLESDKEPVKFSFDVMTATFRHGMKKEQFFLIPIALYVGMEQGFYVGDYTKSYIACSIGTHNIGLVNIFYGISCAFSSTVTGWLVKHMGRMSIILFGQAINIVANIYLLLWVPDPNVFYTFFIGALLWGLITGIFLTQIRALHGILFKDAQEAAFAFYYTCSSVGYTMVYLYSDQICTSYKLYIQLAVSSLGIIGYLHAERLNHLKKQR